MKKQKTHAFNLLALIVIMIMVASLVLPDKACAATVTLQDLTGNANSTFPPTTITTNSVTAQSNGESQLTWSVKTNSPGGAQVKIYMAGLSFPSDSTLNDSITVSVMSSQGSAAVVPDGSFAAGVPLSTLPLSAPAALNLCHTSGSGEGIFILKLTTSAKAKQGQGTISGILTLVATTTP